MSSRLTFFASTALVTLGLAGVAFAQSGPFDAPPPAGTAPAARPWSAPAAPAPTPAPQARPYSAPSYSVPQGRSSAQTYTAPTSQPGAAGGAMSAPYSASAPNFPMAQTTPGAAPAPASTGGTYYPPTPDANMTGPNMAGGPIQYGGRTMPSAQPQFSRGAAFTDPNYRPGSYDENFTPPQALRRRSAQAGPVQNGPMTGGPMSGGPYGGPQTRPQKQSFWDKIGLGKLRIKTDGFLRLGDAFVTADKPDGSDNDRNELVADAMIRSEISTMTSGGTEYGVSLKLRGQRDRLREGFGGLAGDCPPGFADCAAFTVAGDLRALKGHTGQLYNYVLDDKREHKIALEGAHIFFRSAYGDITLGRDDGSAALFSGAAPSTLPLTRASSGRTDYTGLDTTKTLNDASGFAEKITYTSPRLLGDRIGFGVQFGASYAPDTQVCGVDYCVRNNDLSNALLPLSPDLEDAVEFGMAVDRTFANGLSVEGTLTYAAASEQSGFDVFDDLQSYGTGLNIAYGDFEYGMNYLLSNNGIADNGDYSAFDAGLTWKPAKWGVTLGYGQSKDDLAKTEGRSVVLGGSYDWSDAFTLGTGIQYTERDVPVRNGALVDAQTQDALALFVEGGFKF